MDLAVLNIQISGIIQHVGSAHYLQWLRGEGEPAPRSEPWLATLGVLLTRTEGRGRERGRGFKVWTSWACLSLREKVNRHFDIWLLHPEKERNDRIYISLGETDFHFCFKTQLFIIITLTLPVSLKAGVLTRILIYYEAVWRFFLVYGDTSVFSSP